MAEVVPEERVQKVKAHLLEDLEFEPEQVRNFFTTNIFGRALAHLVGYTGRQAKMLRCTEAGELKTAPTTTGIERYVVQAGDATDTFADIGLGLIVSRIDIFIWDHPALFKIWVLPASGFGTQFEVPVGFYSIDIRSTNLQIKNKDAGQTARYQVIGWV